MAVYFCKNYCLILASAVFVCWLWCLKWRCTAYFVCFVVFFVDCSSSYFEKTIEQRQTPAGVHDRDRYEDVRTYRFFSFDCLCADCLGTFWKILASGAACMITFGNLLENSVKVTVSLLVIVDCQMLQLQGGSSSSAFISLSLLSIFYYCPWRRCFSNEDRGSTLCCIAACSLQAGRSLSSICTLVKCPRVTYWHPGWSVGGRERPRIRLFLNLNWETGIRASIFEHR